MSSSQPPVTDSLLSSHPHPDTYVPDVIKRMRAAVHLFVSENGSSASSAAVQARSIRTIPPFHLLVTVSFSLQEAFKQASSALDRAAPHPGQHTFRVGERGVLRVRQV